MKHLLSLKELSGSQIREIVISGLEMKRNSEAYADSCSRKSLLLLFQKTSTRTYLSFHNGIQQLGGYPTVMDWDKSNFSLSPIQYEAKYVSRNTDMIMARLRKHEDLLQLAQSSTVPVINGCCDRYHPCQALADLMTIYEVNGSFEQVTLTYVGIHNNVTNSLVAGCMRLGIQLLLVTPIINDASWDESLMQEAYASGYVHNIPTLEEAVSRSQFVYTDTWVDMEFYHHPDYQTEKQRRMEIMLPYQLNRSSLGAFTPYIMHDMPIHPGFEIAEELVESEHSVIYQQADNRLHVQKALMVYLMSD
ncbi:ornithine carbamoyltransferase [Paenibacillus sp. N3.4]|uniref:ornithine carbamoyltransferase n=1 Tax=Paenibacillus sp. N3.4 TaxID=2603222 RepID=UPI0011CCCACE|nr:ornithine carbamoyltransferase [Paenibacillus sp. N3.4]TXK79343.1 ornithine carbamoyltransferase [Paenibacillus sp. N3.4]